MRCGKFFVIFQPMIYKISVFCNVYDIRQIPCVTDNNRFYNLHVRTHTYINPSPNAFIEFIQNQNATAFETKALRTCKIIIIRKRRTLTKKNI